MGDERQFFFDYDFGDGWEHEIVIEQLTWSSDGLKFAVCVDGENACPPEDVGGAGGYEDFLAAMADPDHEEHDDLLRWVGGAFDPISGSAAPSARLLSTSARSMPSSSGFADQLSGSRLRRPR